mgnify:CR=1 FL=1
MVATNATLERGQLAALAQMSADALGQRITPVGTMFDGDIVFAVSVGDHRAATEMAVEMLAQDATATAIERAVKTAKGTKEVPGLAD